MSQQPANGPYYGNLRFLQKVPRKPNSIVSVVLGVVVLIIVFHFSIPPNSRLDVKKVWEHKLSGAASQGALQNDVPMLRDAQNPGLVVPSPGREIDVVDAFAEYTRYPFCHLSSLELHEPFSPLCPDKASLLDALSGGGRAGIDAAYVPRGCDMRWFSASEICNIMSKFSYVFVIGDSMMRNLAVAFHILLRRDLYEGGNAAWMSNPKGADCHCDHSFETGDCLFSSAWSSTNIWANDPASMWCLKDSSALVEFVPQLKWPLDTASLELLLPKEKPDKPAMFLYGHGMWNDLNETESHSWIDQVEGVVKQTCPWLSEQDSFFKRLFITPSAAGGLKPKKFTDTQGNFALKNFELHMGPYVQGLGMDHLGTINMTTQSTSHDGTHAGMKPNIIKAMMVLNWLNFIDTKSY